MRVSSRRKGYGRTSGYYGRYGPQANRPELKFHDISISDAVVAATAALPIDSCVKIAQGTTESTRIGRKCTVKSINWRFIVQLAAGLVTTTTSDVVRVILFLDKQCNGATAAAGDILETTTDYQSFNNLANKNRFRTLMDRSYNLNASSGGGNTGSATFGEFAIHDSFYKKCNIPIEYDSTAGAITEIRSNNIAVLLVSQGNSSSFISSMRIRFSDN